MDFSAAIWWKVYWTKGVRYGPLCWDEVLGQIAQKDYEKDELI